MAMVLVSSDVSHELPAGTGPSPTTKVTFTIPADVHVKPVLAAALLANVPLGADQLYVTAPGTGAVAVALSMTELPTLVSVGLADTLFEAAQLKLVPLTRVT
jgi:hypothetical protein